MCLDYNPPHHVAASLLFLARLSASIAPARRVLPEVRLRALPVLGHTAYKPPAREVRALCASGVRSVLRMKGRELARMLAEAVGAGDVRR